MRNDARTEAAAALLAPWSVGQTILDSYRVDALLGRGGMGQVYLVRDRFLASPFAVKRALLGGAANRRAFLEELFNWIDLPEHRNIVSCRFFRSVDDEVIIFADYAAGGSLADWIRDRKITTLEQILDIAIQAAWGLHAAHEAGLVHQDVKPANILMSADGTPAVSDFGLARALAKNAAETPGAAGMTAAYCSPEQARRRALDWRTDIWSFGLGIVEMFAGQCFWMSGQAAPEVLEAVAQGNAGFDPVVAMPSGVAGVLRRCFLPAEERFHTMMDLARELAVAFGQALGRPYWKPLPAPAAARADEPAPAAWQHALSWLHDNAASIGMGEIPRPLDLRPSASPRARAIFDLTVYDSIAAELRRCDFARRAEGAYVLAGLFYNKGRVHEHLDDLGGALGCYDLSLSLLARATSTRAEQGAQGHAVTIGLRKADTVRRMGRLDYAVELGRWVRSRTRDSKEKGEAQLVEARALRDRGDHMEAFFAFMNARGYLEQASTKDPEAAGPLAQCLAEAADLAMISGDLREAAPLYKDAVALLERLTSNAPRRPLSRLLAVSYAGYVKVLVALEEPREALDVAARALQSVTLREPDRSSGELALDLARLMLAKASLLPPGPFQEEAVSLAHRSVQLAERVVLQEGRLDLARDLVDIYLEAVAVLLRVPACSEAVGTYSAAALRILEELERSSGDQDLLLPLAEARLCRVEVLRRAYASGGALLSRFARPAFGGSARAGELAAERKLAANALRRLETERGAAWVAPLVAAL